MPFSRTARPGKAYEPEERRRVIIRPQAIDLHAMAQCSIGGVPPYALRAPPRGRCGWTGKAGSTASWGNNGLAETGDTAKRLAGLEKNNGLARKQGRFLFLIVPQTQGTADPALPVRQCRPLGGARRA